jgi:hypothetical protein
MDKRWIFGILIGMNITFIVLLAAGSGNTVMADATDRAERYIAVSGVDQARQRPVLFVIDTQKQTLVLYDVVNSKLRCCSVRPIRYDSNPKLIFELEDKKGGSPKDFKKLQ